MVNAQFYIVQFAMCTVATLLFVFPLCAQRETSLEELLESVAEESEVSPVLDAIDYFSTHPLPLHTATAKELMLIPGFSATTARALLRMVRTAPDISYDSLQQALALSQEQLVLLRLCTSLDKQPLATTGSYRIRSRQQFPVPLGVANNAFAGSPLDLYQRLTLATPWLTASATLQKDAGERSIADFLSAHAHIALANTDIILGDYSVQSGMGTLLWQQFGARKGPDVLSPAVEVVSTIRPYRSSIEQNFFRGIALQRECSLSDSSTAMAALWYSAQQRSATIDTTGTAVSLDADGYFRTPTERQRRNTLGEQAIGGIAEWKDAALAIGTSFLALRYTHPIASNAKTAFAGKEGILNSVYSTLHIGSFSLACEGSRDARGAMGLRVGLHRRDTLLRYAIAFRSFAASFRSPFGYSFGESSQPSNETGLYAAVDWKLSRTQRLRLYTDIYRTGEPTFTVPMPLRGLDMFAEYHLALSKQTALLFRLHREDKTDVLTDGDGIRRTYQRVRTDARLDLSHDLAPNLHTRFRCHVVQVSFQQQQPEEIGVAVVSDISGALTNAIGFAAHIAVFSTPSFSSAVWAYEPALAGTMSAPALFGEGVRGVLRLRYAATSAFVLWLQAAITEKNHVDTLGSGADAIADNTSSQVQLQLDYAW